MAGGFWRNWATTHPNKAAACWGQAHRFLRVSAPEAPPQRLDRRGVVGLAEDGGAGDQYLGPGTDRLRRGLGRDAAVDLDADAAAGRHGADAADLLELRGEEPLAPEAGVHRHDEDEVDMVEHVLDRALGRGGGEGDGPGPGRAPQRPG